MDITIGPLAYSMDNNSEASFRASTHSKIQETAYLEKFCSQIGHSDSSITFSLAK